MEHVSAVQHQHGNDKSREESTTGSASLQQFLPTGTTVGLGVEQGFSAAEGTGADPYGRDTGLDIAVTQSLLRGFGAEVNLVRLRQAVQAAAKMFTAASEDVEVRGRVPGTCSLHKVEDNSGVL